MVPWQVRETGQREFTNVLIVCPMGRKRWDPWTFTPLLTPHPTPFRKEFGVGPPTWVPAWHVPFHTCRRQGGRRWASTLGSSFLFSFLPSTVF